MTGSAASSVKRFAWIRGGAATLLADPSSRSLNPRPRLERL